MKPHRPWVRDKQVLAEAERQAKRAGVTPQSYLTQKTSIGLRMAMGMDVDMTVGDAALYAGVHRNTIRAWHEQNMLPNAYYRTARKLMVPIKDLDALKQATVVVQEKPRSDGYRRVA